MTTDIIHSAYVSLSGVIVTDETIDRVVHSGDVMRLGAGVSRTAYALDTDTVVKVAHTARHFECNTLEVSVWMAYRDTHGDYFARIIAASPSGKWVVMERARGTLDEMCAGGDYSQEDSRRTLRTLASECGGSDLHGGNLGVFAGGKVKCIDYGYFNTPGSSSSPVPRESEWMGSLTCQCDDCLREQHANGSCQLPHASCCGRVSKCVTTGCVINRNTAICAAGSCFRNLKVAVTMPLAGERGIFCALHAPVIGPIFNNWDQPRMFMTHDRVGLIPRFGAVPTNNREMAWPLL